MNDAAPQPDRPRAWLGALPPSGDDRAPLRIAPGLALRWSGESLRVAVPGLGLTAAVAPRTRRRVERTSRRRSPRRRLEAQGRLTAAEAEREALDALDRGDAAALAALEARLTSLHETVFPRGQRPLVEPSRELTPADALEARELAATAAAGIQHRRDRRAAKMGSRSKGAAESGQVQAFLAAGRIAARVRDGYRQAVADSTWRGLEGHDATSVIAALDASCADNASDCTCVDAGRAGQGRRPYVTVVLRVPGPEVVPDRGPGEAATGRPMLRRRSAAQREETYRAVLASATLAAVNHVLSAAVATDDVNVVLVRPALPSATDLQAGGARRPRLEGLHVVRLSREEVTLRPVDADPVLLVLGQAAPAPLLDHDEVVRSEDAPPDELSELVDALNAALQDG